MRWLVSVQARRSAAGSEGALDVDAGGGASATLTHDTTTAGHGAASAKVRVQSASPTNHHVSFIQEGIPVVLMEAMARGLPVISTFHSGIPELVIDRKTGLLVHERDADALSEKLEYLITHPEMQKKMGQEGRKYVEAHYDINKLNDRLLEIYQSL